MTEASIYLSKLAEQISISYEALPGLQVSMLTGSAAKGLSDSYSDIDMTMYYSQLPSEEHLKSIRKQFTDAGRKWLIGHPDEGHFAEAYDVDGIEVQIGHTTVEVWEATIEQVLSGQDVSSPAHKAMEGTLACRAFYGQEQMATWKEKIAAYPDVLAEAVVRAHLKFFPIWGLDHHFMTRDAAFWYYEVLVETVQHIMAVLSGLNRLYFTTFQFKRSRRFIDQMRHKPSELADRLEALFDLPRKEALVATEALVAETIALVETHMPALDTKGAKRRLGWQHQPWQAKPQVLNNKGI